MLLLTMLSPLLLSQTETLREVGGLAIAKFASQTPQLQKRGIGQMGSHRIPVRIARGLTLISNEAAKLERGGLHATSWETHMALKTIKDECDHLRQFVALLAERARHLVD